jgi:hypothetical protein
MPATTSRRDGHVRETAGDDEFFDVAVQLPREYDAVLAGR